MPWIWNTRYIFGYNAQSPKDLLAKAYKEKGDFDQAIKVYERLTDPNPEHREGRLIYPKNYYYLAKCYEMKGQKDQSHNDSTKNSSISGRMLTREHQSLRMPEKDWLG